MSGNDEIGAYAGDLVKGALAGAIATWVMGKATTFFWEHESAAAKVKYEEVTGGKYVPDRAAEKVEKLVGFKASKEQHRMITQTSHWGLGIGAGMVYALLRRLNKSVSAGHGLLFGAAFSAIFDEGLTPPFGLAEAPQKYPWQAHARGFVGHLVYGATAESALKLLEARNEYASRLPSPCSTTAQQQRSLRRKSWRLTTVSSGIPR